MIKMIGKFKKNAKKMVKKAAGIGLGVLFAVNASLTTAHAITAKDIILPLAPQASENTIRTLDTHLRQAMGPNVDGVILDFNALISRAWKENPAADPAKLRPWITNAIKEQILADSGSSRDTKEDVIRSLGPSGVIDKFVIKNTDGTDGSSGRLGPFARHSSLEDLSVRGTGVIFVHAGTPLTETAITNHYTFSEVGEKKILMFRIFEAIHEARHLSQRADFAKLGHLTKLNNGNKKGLTDEQYDLIAKTETDADLTACRGFLSLAGQDQTTSPYTGAEALAFLKASLHFRISNVLDGNDLEHNSLSSLSRFIHTLDPSYEALPEMNKNQLELARQDINQARYADQKNDNGVTTATNPETENGQKLYRLYKTCEDERQMVINAKVHATTQPKAPVQSGTHQVGSPSPQTR